MPCVAIPSLAPITHSARPLHVPSTSRQLAMSRQALTSGQLKLTLACFLQALIVTVRPDPMQVTFLLQVQVLWPVQAALLFGSFSQGEIAPPPGSSGETKSCADSLLRGCNAAAHSSRPSLLHLGKGLQPSWHLR